MRALTRSNGGMSQVGIVTKVKGVNELGLG